MVRVDARRDERTPVGISIAIGALGVVTAGLIAAAIPAAHEGWRFALIAVAVGVFAAVTLDELALGAIALIAFGVFNGFLEDRFGQLSWHGSADFWRLLLLVIACASGLAVGEAVRYLRELRARWRIDAEVEDAMARAFRSDTGGVLRIPGQHEVPTLYLKEEEHGA